ncbi:hypothetical protein EU799_05580 [Corynebacterium silvaticum]|uniref:hypothetical protein n=1 Tax=Corynebacterium silvaticum TaxID=2320431 RepID=UPI001067AEF6|nr:hypothetical protein [Corynebacterium silvaticum]MBH5301018.1 hypothetical protein [Corynebacterium silvaticum]NOM65219.1 hypothetical protein [Corynebacterium silvaticum]NON70854.1 hypothetical protein [Corynebacterium silvaticum]TFA92769.1 hypothetical protein EU802_05400 [Corynebacterium silvaticum]TFA96453.1 hypothetical protein EU799_05580 [Corynebacterium silvaticum]
MNKKQAITAFLAIQVLSLIGLILSGVFSFKSSPEIIAAGLIGSIVIATAFWLFVYVIMFIAQRSEKKERN